MRHRKGYNKLGMESSHRRSVLRNLATSLVIHEEIKTTVAKAKELRRIFDRLVTLGKRGDLHARRQVASFVFNDDATKKLFEDISSRMKDRQGGYTRILKIGPRKGDAADLARIQIVDYLDKKKEAAEEGKKEDKKP